MIKVALKSKTNNNIKIAFIYYSFSSFVEQDYKILRNHYAISKVKYKNVVNVLDICLAVWNSNVSFSWFASGHSFITVIFCKLFRKKSIVIAGGGDVAAVPEINYGNMLNRKNRFVTKFILKNADVILAVSDFTKDEVLKYANPKNLKVVYNGIDIDKFTNEGEKDDLVITVGGISNDFNIRKGYRCFIESAISLKNVTFLLIGKHIDSSVEDLKKIAPPNVKFTGFVSDEDLINLYQKAKVYCQLSYYESFGMGLTEAMACECIPVVANMAALPEVTGNVGVYVPYGDSEETGRKISKALTMDGRASRERVIHLFSLKKREKELIAIINKLVA